MCVETDWAKKKIFFGWILHVKRWIKLVHLQSFMKMNKKRKGKIFCLFHLSITRDKKRYSVIIIEFFFWNLVSVHKRCDLCVNVGVLIEFITPKDLSNVYSSLTKKKNLCRPLCAGIISLINTCTSKLHKNFVTYLANLIPSLKIDWMVIVEEETLMNWGEGFS